MADGKLEAYLELAEEAYKKRDMINLTEYSGKIIDMDNTNTLGWFYGGVGATFAMSVVEPNKALDLTLKCWEQALYHCNTKASRENMVEMINEEYQLMFSSYIVMVLSNAINNTNYARKYSDYFNNFYTKAIMGTVRLSKALQLKNNDEPLDVYFDIPHFPYDVWENEFRNLENRFNGVVARGSLTESFGHLLLSYIHCFGLFNFVTSTTMTPGDQVQAFTRIISVLNDAKVSLSRRFYSVSMDATSSLVEMISAPLNIATKNLSEARVKAYWEQHPEEKKALEKEQEELDDQSKEATKATKEKTKAYKAVKTEMEQPTAEETAFNSAESELQKMKDELAQLGIFQGKRKKELRAQIPEIEERNKELYDKAMTSREQRNSLFAERLSAAQAEMEKAQAEEDRIEKRLDEINKKLETGE